VDSDWDWRREKREWCWDLAVDESEENVCRWDGVKVEVEEERAEKKLLTSLV